MRPQLHFVVQPAAGAPSSGLGSIGIHTGDLQADFAICTRCACQRVAAHGNAIARVAQLHVLAGPKTHGLTQGAQHKFGNAGRAGNAIDQDGVLRFTRRKQLGFGVFGAPLNFEFVGQRFGHAHQAEALGTLVLRQCHIEHKALVELTSAHFHLALTASASAAVVGQGVACTFEGFEHGLAAVACDGLPGGIQLDVGGHSGICEVLKKRNG